MKAFATEYPSSGQNSISKNRIITNIVQIPRHEYHYTSYYYPGDAIDKCHCDPSCR